MIESTKGMTLEEIPGVTWSWQILEVRCSKCLGIVEIPADQECAIALGRHLHYVHGFPENTVMNEFKLH